MIQIIENKEQKKDIAEKILNQLPEWFGMPEATEEYIKCSQDMTFFADIEDGNERGFVVLKETSPYVAEIYVIGVLKEYHHLGIGTALFNAFYKYAKEHGYEFIQVKTVKEGKYKSYDISNAFYKKVGFKEFECFPSLWDAWNPCQVYIMSVK